MTLFPPTSRVEYKAWQRWRRAITEGLDERQRDVFEKELRLYMHALDAYDILAHAKAGAYNSEHALDPESLPGDPCPEPRMFGDYVMLSADLPWERYNRVRSHSRRCLDCGGFVLLGSYDSPSTGIQAEALHIGVGADEIVSAASRGDLTFLERRYGSTESEEGTDSTVR